MIFECQDNEGIFVFEQCQVSVEYSLYQMLMSQILTKLSGKVEDSVTHLLVKFYDSNHNIFEFIKEKQKRVGVSR